ncbi:hypothetical protein [Rhodovastum atsumiense]|uniref:Uncharacterized protein n=1 Tax=Rhodovastum atsumiense TaxID=504468 RepID=A0A5M6IN39_9PROT|nr:hypothetical protein [Rhodovastum atsumiense]KAA5609676.1 hypothetical protein F1189_23230 [Rhodovastum atsumiense]
MTDAERCAVLLEELTELRAVVRPSPGQRDRLAELERLTAKAPRPTLSLADLYARLRREIEAAGGQQAWARAHGISPTVLNDVLTARRDPGPTLLDALGLRRVVRYADVRSSAT